MDKFILTLIATVSIVFYTKADEVPQIQIFEIRQARDQRVRRGDKFKIDYQYYDPDGYDLVNRIDDTYRTNPNRYDNRNVDELTDNLINKLKRIVQSKSNDFNPNDDDYIFKYKDLKNDNANEDDSKVPIVLLTHKSVLYHIIPETHKSKQNRLQSALRSINFDKDIEDRTAPPRTSVRYDYEYDE